MGKKSGKGRSSRKRPKKIVETPRRKAERLVGRDLLRGKIPFQNCPMPSTHAKAFEDCCNDYASGKLSESEALTKVNEILKGVKKT